LRRNGTLKPFSVASEEGYAVRLLLLQLPALIGVLVGAVATYVTTAAQERGRPAGALGPGPSRVAAREQVAVPAQHSVRAHQQPQPTQHVSREPVQQRREETPDRSSETAVSACPVAAAAP
jgi:hypothetical protein